MCSKETKMIIFTYIYKIINHLFFYIRKLQWIIVFLKFKLNRFKFFTDFKSYGIPVTSVSISAKVSIGRKFMMNNGILNNKIGRQQPCFFVVVKKGELTIGENVGISATAIVCWNKIEIGDNVRIGGGTVIYDTDFHSLDFRDRIPLPEIQDNVKTSPVLIEQNVFIGAHCTILKGVTIGQNSIIGACSVVAKNIPANQIWAGNPARFIKNLYE
jgi:acetyltransferase-like isoleucine patch superfamily enzyme